MSSPALVLASGSPRRRDLISQLGIAFMVEVSDVDESLLPGETPSQHTVRLARSKAETIARRHPEQWVLGADTTVIVDDQFLGKPADEQEACAMLAQISGRWHTVVTGYCLLNEAQQRNYTGYAESKVFIRPLSEAQIRAYVHTGEPMDKAGAYAIQGIGASLVLKVEGSYTNVVGLPLAEIAILWEEIHGLDVLVGGSK